MKYPCTTMATAIAPIIIGIASLGANCTPPSIPPGAQGGIADGLNLAACIENVYNTDTSKTPPAGWPQIAIDEGIGCGADVGDLVKLFGSSAIPGKRAVAAAAQDHASEVHSAAMSHKGPNS